MSPGSRQNEWKIYSRYSGIYILLVVIECIVDGGHVTVAIVKEVDIFLCFKSIGEDWNTTITTYLILALDLSD